MKKTNLTALLKSLNPFLIALFLLISPIAGANAACCAGHGGVASCNKATNHQMCKDGSVSPTCTCAAKKEKTKSNASKTKTNKATPVNQTPSKAKGSWWGGKATTTSTKSTSNSGKSAKGCCSKHGGVAQCNHATGYQMCKDGAASPSCTCK